LGGIRLNPVPLAYFEGFLNGPGGGGAFRASPPPPPPTTTTIAARDIGGLSSGT